MEKQAPGFFRNEAKFLKIRLTLIKLTTHKTTTIVLKKNVPIQTTTITGLAVIKLTTSKGAINYSW